MNAPMLSRAPRRGHVHCDCHDGGEGNRARQKWRWTHKRRTRAAENRTWRRDAWNEASPA